MTARPKLLVLLGPTAVGKTALSIELAKALDTEIISGDSMLIYRGFDIGAAKPDIEERQGIVHHLVDIREPWESYSVQEFQQEADACIREMAARGKMPFLVGGTGLYVQSLVEGYVFNETGSDPAYRAKLLRMAEIEGGAAVYDLLCRTDPEAAKTIHPNNVRRVIRALEVANLGGESISREKGEPPYDAFVAGLTRPRPELYDRINERVRQMWADGLADEVRGLLARGVTRGMQAMQGIGYKETAAFLAGDCTEQEAITAIQTATRHFAKRQLTWYRRMKYIHWYDATAPAEKFLNEILSDVRGFFKKRSNLDSV